jgi:hypothetical protein
MGAENTRESIWDAMKRRRPMPRAARGCSCVLRRFRPRPAGCELARPAIAGWARRACRWGRPQGRAEGQGTDLPRRRAEGSLGGNLDRIQIVKGWLDKSGKPQEKIYDVVWSDPGKRKVDAKGKLTPVGNTVDVATRRGRTRSARRS